MEGPPRHERARARQPDVFLRAAQTVVYLKRCTPAPVRGAARKTHRILRRSSAPHVQTVLSWRRRGGGGTSPWTFTNYNTAEKEVAFRLLNPFTKALARALEKHFGYSSAARVLKIPFWSLPVKDTCGLFVLEHLPLQSLHLRSKASLGRKPHSNLVGFIHGTPH